MHETACYSVAVMSIVTQPTIPALTLRATKAVDELIKLWRSACIPREQKQWAILTSWRSS